MRFGGLGVDAFEDLFNKPVIGLMAAGSAVGVGLATAAVTAAGGATGVGLAAATGMAAGGVTGISTAGKEGASSGCNAMSAALSLICTGVPCGVAWKNRDAIVPGRRMQP